MKKDYFIVHKSLLPDNICDVLEAKKLVEKGKKTVNEACKMKNITRNTYYKYKDYVFLPSKEQGNKVVIGIYLDDVKGTLSVVLRLIAHLKGNIVSINQEAPINEEAYVTMAIDVHEMETEMDMFLDEMRKIKGVIDVNLIALE